jgi:hypothetical protein
VTLANRWSALQEWDSEIVAAYAALDGDQVAAVMPSEVTLQRGHARNLVLVVADIAVRSSEALGRSLATLDNSRMRDAALGIAIGRYLAVLPHPDRRDGDNRLAERILTGLIQRREPSARSSLVKLSTALPTTAREALDAEITRVLSGVDLTDLGEWHGDFATDVRSSVVEAIIVEWMCGRADAFGIAIGRDPADRGRPRHSRLRGNSAC